MNAVEDRIGAYALGEVLGEGGMAIVYRAEQSEPVERTVAIKVLKPGMDSRQIVARFESERQTLARLEHPNIAKVFDAGTTLQGRPYFVMELVRGVSITRFCDEQHLDTRSRVKLFVDVCMAVQHAHQKGMIHRDLKPSNILVEQIDGKSIVKVIDFGIAKAISADASKDQPQFTRIGQLVGTPLYMSPEQAQVSGVDIDTRSDIYSLGVVLYELLAGALPLDLENIADYALAIALREQDPPTPSQRVARLKPTLDEASQSRVHVLIKSLKGDLDWIAMKAIAKDRALRYQTASELATDLDHYLHELPVLARAPTAGYLLNRFVRRNRIAVAAAAVAALALTVGAAVATVGFVQARTAERKAVAEAETARQVSSFLVDLFNVSDPGEARGNTITAREILDKASTRVTNELGSAPEVRATLMYTMADVYAKLGLFADAGKLAVPAMELRRGRPDSTEFADSLDQVGRIYRQVNRRSEAEPLHRMALSIRRSKTPIDHVAVAKSLQHVGMDLYAQTKYNEALRALLEARQEISLVFNPLPEERGELTRDIADLYHDTGQFQLALQMFQEALQLFRTGLGVDHPQVANTLGEVAVTLKDMQRYPEAEQAYLEALAGQRKSLGPRHPMVAMTLNNIAVLYRETKKLDQALDLAQEAIAIDRAILGDEHNQTNVARITAARVHMDMGHYSIAEAEFRAILANRRRTLAPDNLDVGLTLGALATLLNIEQRYKESEPLAREARDITRRAFGDTHWQFANMTGIFGATLAGQGRYSEAEPFLVDCYAVLRKTRGDRHPRTLSALQRLIQFYTAWGKKDRAGEMQALFEKIE